MNLDLVASRPVSTISRRNSVYVQVPISSYPTGKTDGSISGDSLKENTPLRAPQMQSDSSLSALTSTSSQARKRKLSDAPQRAQKRSESGEVNVKKVKRAKAVPDTPDNADGMSRNAKDGKTVKKRTHLKESTEEFPNGAFYCHQCNKKRDISGGTLSILSKNSRPKARIKRGYNARTRTSRQTYRTTVARQNTARLVSKTDMAQTWTRSRVVEPQISRNGRRRSMSLARDSISSMHTWVLVIIWAYHSRRRCPKCKDECNCRVCRKSKGLEATGYVLRAGLLISHRLPVFQQSDPYCQEGGKVGSWAPCG